MSELDPFNHADCWVYCDASQDGMATRSKFWTSHVTGVWCSTFFLGVDVYGVYRWLQDSVHKANINLPHHVLGGIKPHSVQVGT